MAETLARGQGRLKWINGSKRRQVLDCASPLALLESGSPSESARGLAQSKTLSREVGALCVGFTLPPSAHSENQPFSREKCTGKANAQYSSRKQLTRSRMKI